VRSDRDWIGVTVLAQVLPQLPVVVPEANTITAGGSDFGTAMFSRNGAWHSHIPNESLSFSYKI